MSTITGYIFAVAILALIPWSVGLPVLRWHPGMRTKEARRTYRWATYGIAVFFTVLTTIPGLVLLWLVLIGVAIWLDIRWFRISRTPAGHAALAFAKEEAHPTPVVYLNPQHNQKEH